MASFTNDVCPRNSFNVFPDFKPWILKDNILQVSYFWKLEVRETFNGLAIPLADMPGSLARDVMLGLVEEKLRTGRVGGR